MQNSTLPQKVKRTAMNFLKQYVPIAITLRNLMRANKKNYEVVNGIKIEIPEFRGYYADPDSFFIYQNHFKNISIEVQPFTLKPLNYRMFRYNINFVIKK